MAEPGDAAEKQPVSSHTQPRDTGEQPGRESQTPASQAATKGTKSNTPTSGKAPKGKTAQTAKAKQGSSTQKTTGAKQKVKPTAPSCAKAPEQTSSEMKMISQRMSTLESMMTEFLAAQKAAHAEKQSVQQPGGSTQTAQAEYVYEADMTLTDTSSQHDISEMEYGGEQAPYQDYGYNEHEYPRQIPDAEEAAGYESQSVYSISGASAGSQEQKPAEITALAAKYAIPSGVGKPLNTQLANSIDYLATHPLDAKNMQETLDKYDCPSNCSALDVPKVNATIWENIKPHSRTKDLKFQRIQKALVKGITAFARSVNQESGALTDVQQDALAMLCNVHHEINCLRKESLRPDINTPQFAHLCKTSTASSSKQLFGEDLGKQVKDLQEEQKVTAGLVKYGRRGFHDRDRTYKPYPAVANRGRSYNEAGWYARSHSQPKHFLGQRQMGKRAPPPHTATRPPTQANQGQFHKARGRDPPQRK